MENATISQFTNDIAPLPERPQFLKVLCILTWVCCGLTFILDIYGMIAQSPERQQEKIEQMRQFNPEAADKLETVLNSESGSEKMMNSVLKFVSALLSAYGAMLMWQLKKTGFYVYIVGEILPYAGFLMGGAHAMAALGGIAGGLGAAVAGIVVGIMVILDLAFIIMYGVNLKYMNK